MLGALEAVTRALRGRGAPHALIGAAAMAGRGVLRSTDDFDLLVTDRAVLRPGAWAELEPLGFQVEVRTGDEADPLAGVVRVARPPADRAVDVVVGRHAWQGEVLARAERHRVGGVEVPLALASDLILLKLYAASPQDLLDAGELLRAGDRHRIEAEVEAHLAPLPREAREAWAGLSQAPRRGR